MCVQLIKTWPLTIAPWNNRQFFAAMLSKEALWVGLQYFQEFLSKQFALSENLAIENYVPLWIEWPKIYFLHILCPLSCAPLKSSSFDPPLRHHGYEESKIDHRVDNPLVQKNILKRIGGKKIDERKIVKMDRQKVFLLNFKEIWQTLCYYQKVSRRGQKMVEAIKNFDRSPSEANDKWRFNLSHFKVGRVFWKKY